MLEVDNMSFVIMEIEEKRISFFHFEKEEDYSCIKQETHDIYGDMTDFETFNFSSITSLFENFIDDIEDEISLSIFCHTIPNNVLFKHIKTDSQSKKEMKKTLPYKIMEEFAVIPKQFELRYQETIPQHIAVSLIKKSFLESLQTLESKKQVSLRGVFFAPHIYASFEKEAEHVLFVVQKETTAHFFTFIEGAFISMDTITFYPSMDKLEQLKIKTEQVYSSIELQTQKQISQVFFLHTSLQEEIVLPNYKIIPFSQENIHPSFLVNTKHLKGLNFVKNQNQTVKNVIMYLTFPFFLVLIAGNLISYYSIAQHTDYLKDVQLQEMKSLEGKQAQIKLIEDNLTNKEKTFQMSLEGIRSLQSYFEQKNSPNQRFVRTWLETLQHTTPAPVVLGDISIAKDGKKISIKGKSADYSSIGFFVLKLKEYGNVSLENIQSPTLKNAETTPVTNTENTKDETKTDTQPTNDTKDTQDANYPYTFSLNIVDSK